MAVTLMFPEAVWLTGYLCCLYVFGRWFYEATRERMSSPEQIRAAVETFRNPPVMPELETLGAQEIAELRARRQLPKPVL